MRQFSPEQAAAAAMVAQARERGLALTGSAGLLKVFTTNVLEAALNEETTEHIEHETNRAEAGREPTNTRNGTDRRRLSPTQWAIFGSVFPGVGKARSIRRW